MSSSARTSQSGWSNTYVARVSCKHDEPTDNARVFTRIRSDAALAAGLPLPRPESPPAGWVPGLSEAWFC